jgi:hypothetical protein
MLALLIAVNAGCASAPAVTPAQESSGGLLGGRAQSDPMFQFQGTWEGPIEYLNAPRFVDGAGHSMNFRLVINADEVSVSMFRNGRWGEIKHGAFKAKQWGSQAVVSSITSGQDEGGLWIESSTFTLVHDSPTRLIVYWVRAVNHLDLPVTNPDYHFAWGGSGEFQLMAGNGK